MITLRPSTVLLRGVALVCGEHRQLRLLHLLRVFVNLCLQCGAALSVLGDVVRDRRETAGTPQGDHLAAARKAGGKGF